MLGTGVNAGDACDELQAMKTAAAAPAKVSITLRFIASSMFSSLF